MDEIVLVTGGCGRIGSQVVEKLGAPYQTIGLDLPRNCTRQTVAIDLGSDDSVKAALATLPSRHIAAVIHLAAYYSFNQKHSELYDKVTVQGTRRLLQALQNFDVDQFVFSSTMLVSAKTRPGLPINEDSPVEPSWDYPLSKVRTEKLIHELRGNMSTVILRIAGVYDDRCHSIPISHQIQRIYEKQLEARLFAGDVTHGAAFLHMDDLMHAIRLTVDKRKTLPKEVTLLLGEGRTLSYDQLQKQISTLLYGKTFKTWQIPKPVAKLGAFLQGLIKKSFIKPWMIDFADDHYELDISRAKKLLGWAPQNSLDQALPKMIRALKADPAGWYRDNQL